MKFIFDKETGGLVPQKQIETTNNVQVQPTKENPEPQSKQEETLDSGEAIYKFRAVNDLTTYQIVDDVTRKTMMVISGYALKMEFNLEELRSSDKIDQLLSGLTDLFRKMIVEQALQK